MIPTDRKVFISYRHGDGTRRAKWLYRLLRDANFDPFLDDVDLYRGEWTEALEQKVRSCPVFIAVITPDYLSRLHEKDSVIQQEFTCALESHGASGVTYCIEDERLREALEDVKLSVSGRDLLLRNLQSFPPEKKKLLRMMSEVCPRAMLEAAEKYSARSIRPADRTPEGLLNKPGKTIARRLQVDGTAFTCTPESLFRLLNSHCALCLSGDGGCGKTFLLQTMFDILRKDPYCSVIYVKLSAVQLTGDGRNPILAHVQAQISDKNDLLPAELARQDHASAVVFLLDGLNEITVSRARMLGAINELTELPGVDNIILTTRYLPSGLSGKFTTATLCALRDDEIRSYLGLEAFQIEKDSILRLPLYLRLYQLSLGGTERPRTADIKSKYALLRQVFIERPVDRFGNVLSEDLRAAYSYFLPFFCFRLANENTLTVTRRRLQQDLRLFLKIFRTDGFPLDGAGLCFNDDDNGTYPDALPQTADAAFLRSLTEQLFPAADTEDGEEAHIRICHQDIRDFFAAYFVRCSLLLLQDEDDAAAAAALWENSLQKFSAGTFDSDVLPLLQQALMQGNAVMRFPFENVNGVPALRDALLGFLYYLANRSIEKIHNGSAQKPVFCERFCPALDAARDFILGHPEAYSDIGKWVIVLDAEIHRRLDDYGQSIRICSSLLALAARKNDTKPQGEVRNNIAKCTLYHACDLARHAQRGYDAEAEAQYREAITLLRDNAADCDLSANLLAMLYACPDPVSEKYLNRLLGEDPAQRRFEAYRLVEPHAAREDDPDNAYSVQTLLSYLLHGYVRITACPDTGLPTVEKTDGAPWDIRERKQDVLALTDRLLKRLKNSSMARCFRALALLQDTDTFDDAMEQLAQSFSINLANETVGGAIPGCFVYSILAPGLSAQDRQRLLRLIRNRLLLDIPAHSPDSFGARYVLEDLHTAWCGLKARFAVDAAFCADIDRELRSLSDLYQEESQKWNP